MKKSRFPAILYLSFLLAGLFFSLLTLTAQTDKNTFTTSGWWGPPPPKFSPEVHGDLSVTFRIEAPNAQKVELWFDEWFVTKKGMEMDKDGVWSATLGPVAPGFYGYFFMVDGLKVLDLKNPDLKSGTEVYSSVVDVPGLSEPRFDEFQDVPHGETRIVTYHSEVLNRTRKLDIFLPPQYEDHPDESFPVLYLRHGGGDTEASWLWDGRAGVILENLLAKDEALPMIIVMMNGFTDGTWASGSTKEGMGMLEKELLMEIIPLVNKKYRTRTEKESTAITGLSMGGGQAFVMGLNNLDVFDWVGQFSSGLLASLEFDINDRIPGFADKINEINELSLLYIACGENDSRYEGHLDLLDFFEDKHVKHVWHHMPGGHEWLVWRTELYHFMKLVFKEAF